MLNRWYDKDATLSLMVSLIKNTDLNLRLECAKIILDMCKENEIFLDLNFFDNVQYSLKRWYDKEKPLFEAFEYLHAAPEDVRKKIVIDVIDFLQSDKVTE